MIGGALGIGRSAQLDATTTKTAGVHALAVRELATCDATTGAVRLTLPTGAADGDTIVVRRLDASSYPVTVLRGGIDSISIARTRAYAVPLAAANTAVTFVSDGAGSWTPIPAGVTLWSGRDALTGPAAAGWPAATTAGYAPTGATLSAAPAGDVTSTADGEVIEDLDITGRVLIQHNDVTIRRCRITVDNVAVPVVANSVLWNGGAADGLRTVIEDCTIIGNGSATGSYTAIGAAGGTTVTRCDISGFENGIITAGDNVDFTWCYVHGFVAPGTPHYDGVECNGTSGVRVATCTIVCDQTQTSAINYTSWPGAITSGTIDANLIDGGGYTLTLDSGGLTLAVTVTGNRFGATHSFGVRRTDAGVTILGDTGNVLDADNTAAW